MTRWPIVPLGSVVEFLDHMRKPVTASGRVDGPYPYYGANGRQGSIDGYIFDEPLLLLAEDGGHFDNPTRGIAYRISGKSWVNNHAHVLRMTPALDLDYACAALANMDVRRYITGTTRSKLTKAGASRIGIPLPPLEEQCRIAAILDQADFLRLTRSRSIDQLNALAGSLFTELFGSQEFKCADLSEVVQPGTIVTYGIVQAGPEHDGGIPYIRTGDIVDGAIRTTGLRHTDPAIAAKFERSRVAVGDIVMSIRATVGTTAFVPPELDGANLTQGTAKISPSGTATGSYLLNYLRSPIAQRWIQAQVKGATFREITLGALRQLPVPLAPVPLQQEFDRRLRTLTATRLPAMTSSNELNELLASLQSRAFRGEL